MNLPIVKIGLTLWSFWRDSESDSKLNSQFHISIFSCLATTSFCYTSGKKCTVGKNTLQFFPKFHFLFNFWFFPVWIFPSIFNFSPFSISFQIFIFSPFSIFSQNKNFPIFSFPTKFKFSQFSFFSQNSSVPNFHFFSLRPWFFSPSNFQFCSLDGIRTWDLSYTTLKSKGLNPSYDTNFFDMSENLLIFPTVYCASNQAKSLSPHPV